MEVIVDTREQLPYWTDCHREALHVGDYTTVALKGKFHVERKSLADLYGTLTKGNGRFKYELFRAAYSGTHLEVYVEGSRDQFINKIFPKGNERKFSTHGLDALVNTFEKKYHLRFNWCMSRLKCKKSVKIRLEMEEKKLKNKSK